MKSLTNPIQGMFLVRIIGSLVLVGMFLVATPTTSSPAHAAASPVTTIPNQDSSTAPVKIVDLCPNIEGSQTTIPSGMFADASGNCVKIVDLCPNIEGSQTTIPSGMFADASGNCVKIVDLCPNIAGVQATVPAGVFVDAKGNCVPIVDRCKNIAGVQATVPSGMYRMTNGNCFRRIVVNVPVTGKPRPGGNQGNLCILGGTGPGGGIVFYVASSQQPWGRCLEAAPKIWKGGTSDPVAPWGCGGTSIPGAQGTAIGTGQANTTAIVNACTTAGIAARLADNLVFGGKLDWFLPSKAELNMMYQQKAIIGGFISGYYWSSSEYIDIRAWGKIFTTGNQYDGYKYNAYYVRPVRAFG